MAEPQDDERREEIVAYLDGELDQHAAAEFEQRLQRDAALRADAEAMKRTWELLDFLPQPEPSATFTSKTLDKISVLRPAATSAMTLPAAADAILAPAAPARPRSKWPGYLGWTAAALALFALGYIASAPAFRKGPKPVPPQVAEEEMARDLRILNQLPQYEVGEDIAFLKDLDQPELFGDESSR